MNRRQCRIVIYLLVLPTTPNTKSNIKKQPLEEGGFKNLPQACNVVKKETPA